MMNKSMFLNTHGMYTRRNLIKSTSKVGATVAGSVALSGVAFPYNDTVLEDNPRIKRLVTVALDSAVSSGASYADLRLTHNYAFFLSSSSGRVSKGEAMSIGVRTLVDGCWGFASSTVWDETEAIRLSSEAVSQARAIAKVNRRDIRFTPVPVVDNGSWISEGGRDPFSIDPKEIKIHCDALIEYASNYMEYRGARMYRSGSGYSFEGLKQESVFGSTDGSFLTQVHYITGGEFNLALNVSEKSAGAVTDLFTHSKEGLERLFSPKIRESIKVVVDDLIRDAKLAVKPIDVGRYEAVLDHKSVTSLVSQTIGLATEHDRILGVEANASGTSYINNLNEMLGSFNVGSKLLNVSANRSEAGGAATVMWDDEGVKPSDFYVITNGVLSGISTSREFAMQGDLNAESNGCLSMGFEPNGILAGGGAVNPPTIQSPNLVMEGSDSAMRFDDLVREVKSGIAFKRVNFMMDFQQLNGLGRGSAYEIKNGEITARLTNAALLIRAPEFWNSLFLLGGNSDARRIGYLFNKGEPFQRYYHSVTAPCAAFSEATVIDITKKS